MYKHYTARELLLFLALRFNGEWDKIYEAILNREPFEFEEEEKQAENLKANYLTILDDNYPAYLKNIYKPPFVLFYYGDISLLDDNKKCLSVVGSRKATPYGSNITREIVKDVCKDYIIVSGLALGIDAVAHQTCLDNSGKTIGIIGCGIDRVYPEENYSLYQEIKNNGLLISEYPNKYISGVGSFPFRNRLIAACSKGTLVTEAYERSGTMITVNYALEYGHEILVVPYSIDAHCACNRLIREGGVLVESGDDVLSQLSSETL